MLRSLVKTSGSRVLHWTGVDRLKTVLSGSAKFPVVIGYHRVVEDFALEAEKSIPAMLISISMLERHLEWLGNRFDLISIDELCSTLQQGGKFDRPIAAITFDDGYRDNYYNAFPLLKHKKIPAAIFVTTNWIDSSGSLIHDKLYDLLHCSADKWDELIRQLGALFEKLGKSTSQMHQSFMNKDRFEVVRLLLFTLSHDELCHVARSLEMVLQRQRNTSDGTEPLTWDMVAEMHHAGMTIGSHTHNHVLLTHENDRRVQQELETSRKELERQLGTPIRHFAYPDGRFDRSTVEAVAAAGYRYAFTTCRHRDPDYPLLTIPRILLWENSCLDADGSFSPYVMSCHVNGWFDFLFGCAQHHRSAGKRSHHVFTEQEAGRRL